MTKSMVVMVYLIDSDWLIATGQLLLKFENEESSKEGIQRRDLEWWELDIGGAFTNAEPPPKLSSYSLKKATRCVNIINLVISHKTKLIKRKRERENPAQMIRK